MALVACSKPHSAPNELTTCGTETYTIVDDDRDIYLCRSSLTVSWSVWSSAARIYDCLQLVMSAGLSLEYLGEPYPTLLCAG